MFSNILLPTDLRASPSAAVDTASELAGTFRSNMHLVHVIELLRDTPFDELKEFYHELETSARAKLSEISRKLESKGISAKSHILYGVRLQELTRFITDKGIDLVVLQSHQIDMQQPFEGWGTLSYKLSMLAPCPVLLVK